MSGLHREPCAWQEKAMPIPAPAFHSCCNSHKRLLKPKKNKTVILIKQRSGTLKTRWRLLRPTLKLCSLFQKLHFLCAGWMDAGGLTPRNTVMWYFSRESAGGSPCSTAAILPPKYRENPPSPGSPGPLLKASWAPCLQSQPSFAGALKAWLSRAGTDCACLDAKAGAKAQLSMLKSFLPYLDCRVEQKPQDFPLCTSHPQKEGQEERGFSFPSSPSCRGQLSGETAVLTSWHVLQQGTASASASLWSLKHRRD